MTSYSIPLSWPLAYGTTPSCSKYVTNDMRMPTASSGATMRANVIPAAFIAVISLSPESRCTASSVPSSSAMGMTSTTSPGSDHKKTSKRRPDRRVVVADQLADIENLGRGKDQGEGGETEDERTGKLRQHVPVENRQSYSRNPSPR